MSEVVTTSALLEHFERISEAPDAVARLRRFVLELAVRGRLVEQDETEGSGAQLLARVRRGRAHARAVEHRAGESEQPLPEVPVNWTWAVINEIAADQPNSITDGPFGANLKTEHYVSTPGYRVIRLQNIGHGIFLDQHRSYIDAARFQRLSKHHLNEGDLVVAGLVDPLLRCCQLPAGTGAALVKADCYRLSVHSLVSAKFACLYLNSSVAQGFASAHNHGMTLVRIGLGNFRRIPFPLPPPAEQHRIVAKVDELMALCDELEAAQTKREKRRDRLVAASLHALTNGEGADEPASAQAREHNVRFYLNHLPRLTTRPEHIQHLRQTILDLAVCGCLVEQVAGEEPPAPARSRSNAGLEQSRVTNPAGNSSAFPCALPPGWVAATLLEIATSISDGDHLPPPKTESGVPFLVIGDVRSGRPDFTNCRHVEESYYTSLDSIRKPQQGDVLYTLVGSFGIPVVVSDARRFCIQRHIAIIRPGPLVDVTFLARVLASRFVFNQAAACATGIAQKTVPLSGLRRIVVPVPPLAEQHRIVAKVDELIGLCDALEVSLTARQTARSRVLEARLHNVVADSFLCADPRVEFSCCLPAQP